MNEREELIKEEKSFIFSSFYKLLIIFLVIVFAIFIGKILFGTRSLEVYLNLDKEERILQEKIKKIKDENEKLQKELFEYQLSVPDKE
jgi:cell division protein FtsB